MRLQSFSAILLLFGSFTSASCAQVSQLERDALITLFSSTAGTKWENNNYWNGPPGTECDWFGVSCANSHVSAINLSKNQLKGVIPPEIGDLKNLSALSLWTNELTGSIPSEIGDLRELTSLNLAVNNLTGSIPSALGNLSKLRSLQLYGNDFTGRIPFEIGELSQLSTLLLKTNYSSYSGIIPTSVKNLPNLSSDDLNNLIFIPPDDDADGISNASDYYPTAPAQYKMIDDAEYKIIYSEESLIINLVSPAFSELFSTRPSGETRIQDGFNRQYNLAQLIYKHFDDTFNFLIVANKDRGEENYHSWVKLFADGIGMPSFLDKTDLYGSSGELYSFILLSDFKQIRYGTGTHEIMHAWAHSRRWESLPWYHGNYTNFGGILGGWIPNTLKQLDDGNYQVTTITNPLSNTQLKAVAPDGWAVPITPYSNFELYLAGLIGPNEIGHDLKRAVDFKWIDQKKGVFSASEIQTTTIEEYITEVGERVPNYLESPKHFEALYVVISDVPLTLEEWNEANDNVHHFQLQKNDGDNLRYNFWESTKGKATMSFNQIDHILTPGNDYKHPYVPTTEWPSPYNGVTPRSSLGLPFNNIGIFHSSDSTIYTCLGLFTNGVPSQHNGVSEFDVGLKVVSLSDATVRIVKFREFNKIGALTPNFMSPDCSGKFETNTGIYTDIIQTENSVLETSWTLIDSTSLTLKLNSFTAL